MLSYIRNKPEHIRVWYVYVGTALSLFCILSVYFLLYLHKKTGSFTQSLRSLSKVGEFGMAAFNSKVEDLRAPLRPIQKDLSMPRSSTQTRESMPDIPTESPQFSESADI